ncbi:MAG: Signal transduction histidine kinase [Alphaproteobacteria bacterium]|nr:Signal transduction histidine kinase [Alphaproteobacteria bacterium]
MSALAYGLDPSSRIVLAALPVAIYTTDADGRITFYNEAIARLWGREPELGQERWCAATRLIGPDGEVIRPEDSPVAAALKTGKVVRAEAILKRPDDSQVDIIAHCTPLFDERGRLTGGVNMLVDVTEQKALERAQAHHSAIVESSDDAILSKGLDGIIRSWNKGAERLFGYSADEAVGQPVLMLIPEDRHNEEPGIIARIRQGERVDHFETVRSRKDGSLMEISLTISPVRDKSGVIIGASKIARDISDRRRAEEAKDLLLHEIKHRVKNTLGTVQAIASQTFRGAPREERDAFGARLRAMAEAHDVLTNREWGDVTVTDIVIRAVAPFNPARFTLRGDDSTLSSAKGLLLAMAVHELCTNAVKYGALSNGEGRIAIDWHGTADRLVLGWQESGGPHVEPPTRRGFGTNLIQRAMAGEQGGAQFVYAPDGLKGTLEIRF